MEELELLCMKMISMSGSAKTKYIGAIEMASQGLYSKSLELLEHGKKELQEAYEPHLQLLQSAALKKDKTVSLLLVHAEDQLSSAELFEVVCSQMIQLYQTIEKNKREETKCLTD